MADKHNVEALMDDELQDFYERMKRRHQGGAGTRPRP
jgi:hypothetical protein